MAGFLYFFPDSPPLEKDGLIDHAVLKPLLLDLALEDVKFPIGDAVLTTTEGPEHQVGQFLYPKPTHGRDPAYYGYKPEIQTWLDRGDFWLGWETEQPPGPEDLQRKAVFHGYSIRDGQGQPWHIPIVRSQDRTPSLPSDYIFSNTGELESVIKLQYRTHWELAGEMFERLEQIGDMTSEEIAERWPEEMIVRACLAFVGINYRIGPHEATALHHIGTPLLETEWLAYVIHAVTDWPVYLEFKKKRQRSAASAAPGSTGTKPSGSPSALTASGSASR